MIPLENARGKKARPPDVHKMAKIPPMPPLRCQALSNSPISPTCGRPATHERVSKLDGRILVICSDHVLPGDAPVRAALTIPTVNLTCEIAFAGVSRDAETAIQEAIHTLGLAVMGAGGRLSVTSSTSSLGRYYPFGAGGGRPPGQSNG